MAATLAVPLILIFPWIMIAGHFNEMSASILKGEIEAVHVDTRRP
jgi:hypothetical protein